MTNNKTRIIKALRNGPVDAKELLTATGLEKGVLGKTAKGLIRDNVIRFSGPQNRLLELVPFGIDRIMGHLDSLTDEERMEVFRKYCAHCGTRQPEEGQRCQCWNDE